MSIHKLTAGSGYDYLTRQVAAMDATEKGHTSLATYYTDHGETPGQWMGSGMAGIDGLDAGDPVTAEQMKALFGYGFHPLADSRIAQLADSASTADVKRARQLGTPFKVYEADVPPYRIEVARRLEDLNVAEGRPREAVVSLEERARMRTEVAREYFVREHGREPADARELASAVALYSRPKTTAVAGYDLTFSPVKSVSALWAVADPATSAVIERAHNAAVKDALAFIEREALYTRTGTNGVEQVDVRGLVATAFTHRDSRAGDPDLHTHIAIANKVQTTKGGKWLAIDGRLMFQATVAASETYNTALERHLESSLGVRFEDRENTDRRKRPVREIVGVDARLNERWSTRRQSIEECRDVLVAKFHADHGRPPTAVEAVQLAQQATLETRDAKHEPRSMPEQRAQWAEQATDVLGVRGLDQMVTTALRPAPLSAQAAADRRVDAAWIERVAGRVVEGVQDRRSTWNRWNLISEAQRHVRRSDVRADQVQHLVNLVVDQAIAICQPLGVVDESVTEPEQLQRRDGASVYTVVGAELYTSPRILAAEQRIVEAAGVRDRHRVAPVDVDLALLESAANGVELNAGQDAMVRGMACSGARVQLGIAAAGTGKTTAMRVLTRAWEGSGGNVIGLAPSAAAAAALREQTGTTTDTLAKLVDSLQRGTGGALVDQIGAGTLVVIDEAGMADTLSLDTAITAVLERGASVRLIGDDQQLAAIGAGGVLRDISDRHGALKLAELMRFSDPAEGAATLALREGLPEVFGYYFDTKRIHVGDVATLTDEIFTAWRSDRAVGKDAVMLAPTRELVAELNGRARAARLGDTGATSDRELRLADGNSASVGDVVLTRNNDRRLRISATDWVKNGDRWRVDEVRGTALSVRHVETGLRVLLPANYVAAHTELGYASTVHTAQGISADTMHGLVTGDQTRQQLYTMMSRGRHENHAYVVVASDGDAHGLIRPEALRPPTAGDVLTQVLARDESPRSATTLMAEAQAPQARLQKVTAKYADAIYVAVADLLGDDVVAGIDTQAEVLVPGLVDEAAWPALRAHLVLLQAQEADAIGELADAVAARDIESADDRAAVLDWRLDPTGRRGAEPGPLPWLPAVPARLAEDTSWGTYLGSLADEIQKVAGEVHAATTEADSPAWARHARLSPTTAIAGDIAVWRAATGVDEADRRPTGPRQMQKSAVLYQRELDTRLDAGRRPAMDEWGPAIHALHPRSDSFTPLLAERLAAINRSGANAADLLGRAAAEGPLPDEHVAAALWWRIARHLSPAVAAEQNSGDGQLAPDWADLLHEHLGVEEASNVTSSPWWPTLVATVDQAHERGWPVEQLLDFAKTSDVEDLDLAQAIIWRIALMTDPPPEHDYDVPEENLPPEDRHELHPLEFDHDHDHDHDPELEVAVDVDVDVDVDELDAAAHDRELLEPAGATGSGLDRLIDRAWELQASPVPVQRINAVNAAAADYFESQFSGSWAQLHVHERLGVDLAGDERFRPGYAPAGWTNLVDHLRGRGFTASEMLAAGVAKEASNGRVIDRLRDRAVLPVITDGRVIGFVGRRNPDATDDLAGPKYLNSPDTVVFHKGAQLYGIADDHVSHGAVPVLVEGPFDAIAVTIASGGAFVGVAPLGTSTTEEQAAQLAGLHATPLVATDGDLAGRIAAERDLWLLAPHLVTPRVVPMPIGADPASLLEQRGPAQLVALLQQHRDLAALLVDERLTNLADPRERSTNVAEVIAVMAPEQWEGLIATTASAGALDAAQLRTDVAAAARSFNQDPQRYCTDKLGHVSQVRQRLEGHDRARPADRWAALGRSLDGRLTARKDWPAAATMLQQLHDQGVDVEQVARQAVATRPLGANPSRDLRYRLAEHLSSSQNNGSAVPLTPSAPRPETPRGPQQRPDRAPRR
ncbi:MAG: MobF family relaxase [Aeromicrobium sp.]|uniref:MobF family relaxase n=1 Tax=Aeromicrobium sp. TaxID=1871063 RepID=UPI00262ED425|nr:MobF family relaxase [Aeromicrobium sp.]MDF1706168.1 MobF family relaxase [Aeromicrobium sp.]